MLHVKTHELFERRGDDLFCEIPVPFETLALGGDVDVPTRDGYAKLKGGAGTENGKVLRLRGKGIENVEGYGRGDLHVRVVVEVPAKLDGRQKKLIQELESARSEDGYPLAQRFAQWASSFYERKAAINKKGGNA